MIHQRPPHSTPIATAITAGEINKIIKRMPIPSNLMMVQHKGIFRPSESLLQLYDQVERQPDLLGALQSYNEDLLAYQIVISSNVKNSKRAAFFNDFVKDFDAHKIMEIAADARNYGFTVIEIDRWRATGALLLPAVINQKPGDWFGYDSEGHLRFFPKSNNEGVSVAQKYPNKFLNPRHKARINKPYGRALLDTAYWLAVGLNGNFEYMMHFAEKDGMDKWVAHHRPDATKTEINGILEHLLTLRASGVAVIPEGTNIEKATVQGRASSTALYKDIDEMLRRKVEKLVVGTDLTIQVAGKGGYSSSQSGIEEKQKALNASIRIIEATFKQLFDYIAAVNNLPGSDQESIEVKLFKKENIDENQIKADQAYVGMGMTPTKSFFLNRGYTEDEFTYNTNTSQKDKDQDFSAADDFGDLLDVFDDYKKNLKKKDN